MKVLLFPSPHHKTPKSSPPELTAINSLVSVLLDISPHIYPNYMYYVGGRGDLGKIIESLYLSFLSFKMDGMILIS